MQAEAGLFHRPHHERERIAELVARRLDGVMTALGVIFLLVVLGESLTAEDSPLQPVFAVVGWGLWALFVTEFAARAVIAPSRKEFFKKNWWQLIFLFVPFLRFLRTLRALRALRAGKVVSSALRASRASKKLVGRLGWLIAVTTIVILASSQLLFELGNYDAYARALHDAALGTMTGEPLSIDSGLADILEVVLAAYSVVVFAGLAGSLGAFFLERRVGEESEAPLRDSGRASVGKVSVGSNKPADREGHYMSEATFTCDRCGRKLPQRQMKEVMYESGKDRERKELCPQCLDEVMNESGIVKGIAGEEKRAAVHISDGSGKGERASFGTREET